MGTPRFSGAEFGIQSDSDFAGWQVAYLWSHRSALSGLFLPAQCFDLVRPCHPPQCSANLALARLPDLQCAGILHLQPRYLGASAKAQSRRTRTLLSRADEVGVDRREKASGWKASFTALGRFECR